MIPGIISILWKKTGNGKFTTSTDFIVSVQPGLNETSHVQQLCSEELFMKEIICRKETDTRGLGFLLGQVAGPGDVVGLIGDLGAGKTVFAQGLALGLGVSERDYVCSPTFTLINEHQGRIPFYHVDLYRIGDADELYELGLDEYLNGNGVCVVEWFDKFEESQPPSILKINIDYMESENPSTRRIQVTSEGKSATALAERWMKRMGR